MLVLAILVEMTTERLNDFKSSRVIRSPHDFVFGQRRQLRSYPSPEHGHSTALPFDFQFSHLFLQAQKITVNAHQLLANIFQIVLQPLLHHALR